MKIKEIKQKIVNYRELRRSQKYFAKQLLKVPCLPQIIDRSGDGIAIVAIFKNESRYLAEWIQFHRTVGFDQFILYDNGSNDNSRQIAEDNADNIELTIIDWERFTTHYNPQLLSYSHAAANFGMKSRWMCFIDIDEFMFPVDNRPIGEVLEEYTDIPGVAVPWHMYGTSRHATPPEGGVIENFQHRAIFPPRGGDIAHIYKYKTIFQPRYLTACHVHLPFMSRFPEYFFNERKEKIPRSLRFDTRFASSEVFRLNHYYTKDMASLDAKMNKGRVSALTSGRRKLMKRASIVGEGEICDPIALRKWQHFNALEVG